MFLFKSLENVAGAVSLQTLCMKIAVFKIFNLYMFNIFCELKSSLVSSKRVLLLTRIACFY